MNTVTSSERGMTAPSPGPLASPVFRALWIATIVSNIRTWMHDVGAGWLMTANPLMVALNAGRLFSPCLSLWTAHPANPTFPPPLSRFPEKMELTDE
jgi:hypothetical protein